MSYTGLGILPILGMAFIILRLIGYITWPWMWVVMPILAPLVVLFIGFIVVLWLSLRSK